MHKLYPPSNYVCIWIMHILHPLRPAHSETGTHKSQGSSLEITLFPPCSGLALKGFRDLDYPTLPAPTTKGQCPLSEGECRQLWPGASGVCGGPHTMTACDSNAGRMGLAARKMVSMCKWGNVQFDAIN